MRVLIVFSLGVLLLVRAGVTIADEPSMATEPVQFEANGRTLSGLYSAPVGQVAQALVIIVHGYGKTNVLKANAYYDLRTRLADQGIASFVWDKPGCGDSEGEFDANQPVASSAQEVVAAAAFLRVEQLPGTGQIGLWGISRAGWIAPLALAKDPALAFWISVSGVDDKESFGYLLASNWRIEGYDQSAIDRLLAQWMRGNAIAMGAGSYNDYVAATTDYHADPFVQFVSGRDGMISEEVFESWRAAWKAMSPSVDPKTGLAIYVEDFPQLLSGLNVPVLAMFGEKDTSVDWRAARALYQKTIGANPKANLTIRTFPDGNHNLHVSETGGFREMMEVLNDPQRVPGYYGAMFGWLKDVTRSEK
ncbi:MAG: alpha/beta hydrolase family protein [Gammaproteobacteria bacterium]